MKNKTLKNKQQIVRLRKLATSLVCLIWEHNWYLEGGDGFKMCSRCGAKRYSVKLTGYINGRRGSATFWFSSKQKRTRAVLKARKRREKEEKKAKAEALRRISIKKQYLSARDS